MNQGSFDDTSCIWQGVEIANEFQLELPQSFLTNEKAKYTSWGQCYHMLNRSVISYT